MDAEVQDFLDRHCDAIAGVLEAAKKEELRQQLMEAVARTFDRQVNIRDRWEAQTEIERVRELVVATGIPVVLATQRARL